MSNRVENNALTDRLAEIAAVVASAGLVTMTVVVVVQVFGRYILNDSPAWAESMALVVMLYFILLGAAVGVHEGFHLGLRLFVARLPAGPGLAIYLAGQILVAVFGVIMALDGFKLVDFTASHTIPSLDVSRSVAYWPFVICGALIAVFAIGRCVHAIANRKAHNPWN